MTRPASAVDWQFNPPHSGRVLDEGGWFQAYNLGAINASPEFNFPLQLVYINTRANSGLFGPQWYCPQLESTVIPQGQGTFTWQMPSGIVDVFRAEPDSTSDYFDTSRQWFAKFDSDRQLIQNQEGWLYEYRRGHLVAVTSPTNRILVFTWVADELQGIQIQDAATGQGTTLLQAGYTDSKRINTLFFGGNQHQFAYFPGRDGRMSDWLSSNKQHYAFIYADVGILEYATDSTGVTQTFSTELDDTKLSSSDQKDPAHWRLMQDADQKYTYTTSGKTTITSGTGLTLDKEVNFKRGIVTETVAGGVVRKTYYYRAPGQKYDGKLRQIEENGKVIVEYYYSRKTGLLTSTVDEYGTTTHFDYPDNWKPTRDNPWEPKPIQVWKGTPENPQIIAAFQYDAGGHLVAAQDQAGQITRYTYDSRNQVASVTNPQGITTTVSRDSMGRPIQSKTGELTQSVVYDEMGRVKSQTTSAGVETEFEYDGLGNISKISQNGKIITEYVRDDKGKVTGIKDALGHLKKVEMDNKGNITSDYAPDGSCTKYEYDAANHRISQTDGNGNKTSFAYDPAGHVVQQTNPLGETIKWNYDARGRLLTKTTAEQIIDYTYGTDNNLSVVDYGAGQKVNCEYDDHGRIVSAVTPQTSLTGIYDPSGSLSALRYVRNQDEQLIRLFYNNAGLRTGLVLAHLRSAVAPTGGKIGKDAQYDILQQTEYSYDDQGRLIAILSNRKPVVSYQYDAWKRVSKKIFGNGMTADLSYDAVGRLTNIVFSNGPIMSPLALSYEWDAANQVIRRTWNGEIRRYEYDPNGQLDKVIDDKSGNILEGYAYDKAGNMVEKILNGQKTTLVYNSANELISSTGASGSVSYSYDKAGRMVSNGAVTNSYGWLDKVIQATSASGARMAMTYWPDGQLASEGPLASSSSMPVVSQPTQGWQVDVRRLFAQGPSAVAKEAANVPDQPGTEYFLWDGIALLRRDDVVYVTEPHLTGGATIASHPIFNANETTYYLNDLLGTALAVVENDQIKFYQLTSFGQLTKQAFTAPQPTAIQTASPSPPVSPQQQIPPTSN